MDEKTEVTKGRSTTTSPKASRIQVASLKPCDIPKDENGKVRYKMCYVTTDGKQTYQECTRDIYDQIRTQQLDFRKKSDFVLTMDEDQIVTHILEKAKPDLMPGFTREDEERRETSKYLIVALKPGGEIEPVHMPDRVSTTILNEVVAGITAAGDSHIGPGTKVGRYMVMERRDIVGAAELSINPMPVPGN